ncbi:DUF4145 domain-containing protein [Burkholderia sp. Ax-1719]|uniref:DUF4145 domain-containing protein n=1 Tax=Burkholderia sp. Ax-1719 TaxID=2608334 RepID=UPI00196642AD
MEAVEAGGYLRYFNGEKPSKRYSLLCCSGCQSPIVVEQTNIGNMAEGDKWDTPSIVYPEGDIQVNQHAPHEIRRAFAEVCWCYRAQAYTASAVMCRKTLEGVCEANGISERNLSLSLKKMKECSLIDERLFDWSDALRAFGNAAAHGVATAISQADAKDALEFTNAILDYMFSYRDRFEQFKQRRAKG